MLHKIVEKIFSEGKNKKSTRKPDISTLISGAKMSIEAIIAETLLTAREILDIKENDIILFNKNATSSSAKLYVNKKEKFLTVSGISSNRKAIQIRSNLDKEKLETLETLRKMREDRIERARVSSDNINRLLKDRKAKKES